MGESETIQGVPVEALKARLREEVGEEVWQEYYEGGEWVIKNYEAHPELWPHPAADPFNEREGEPAPCAGTVGIKRCHERGDPSQGWEMHELAEHHTPLAEGVAPPVTEVRAIAPATYYGTYLTVEHDGSVTFPPKESYRDPL